MGPQNAYERYENCAKFNIEKESEISSNYHRHLANSCRLRLILKTKKPKGREERARTFCRGAGRCSRDCCAGRGGHAEHYCFAS